MMIKVILGIYSTVFFWTATSSFSSYFEKIYGEGEKTRERLQKEFFQCDRDGSCTNVIKTKSGNFETVNGEKKLKERKNISCIWKKIKRIEKIPGRMLCFS